MSQNLADELQMTHLTGTLDDLKAASEDESPLSLPEVTEDPRDNELYPFNLDFTDSRGKRHHGRFVNKIQTIGMRQKIGILQAKLAGGVSYDLLDPETLYVNRVVATLAHTLVEKPKWANDLINMVDWELVMAIHAKTVDHENHFFRRGPTETSGSESAQGRDEPTTSKLVDEEVQTTGDGQQLSFPYASESV